MPPLKPKPGKRAIVGGAVPPKPVKLPPTPRRICTPDQRLTAMRMMRAAGISNIAIAHVFGLSEEHACRLMGPHEAAADEAEREALASLQETLARDLRAFRARHRLTQAGAARLLGLRTPSTVNSWETGRHGCAMPDMVLRFLRLLDETGLVDEK